jgi:peptidyl-prolyl cis-trans isomerase C
MMGKFFQTMGWIGFLGGGLALAQAAAASADAVSASPQRVLTAADYRSYLQGLTPEEQRRLTGRRDQLRDLALDFHSDVVLAEEAENLGLAEDPQIAAQLRQARRRILIAALMEKAAEGVEYPADLEALARERYALHKARLRTPERRRVAHILLTDSINGSCDTAPPARERAAALREELLAGGDFAAAAREHSQDRRTAEAGGLLPDWIKQDGKTVRAFEEAAFALGGVGEISPPVESPFGVHLIQLLEVEPSRQRPFDEVKETLMQQLRAELRSSALEQKRSAAYPDPEAINFDLLEQVAAELRQEKD